MHMPKFMPNKHHTFSYMLPMLLCENKNDLYLCLKGIRLPKTILYMGPIGFTNEFFLVPDPLCMVENRYPTNTIETSFFPFFYVKILMKFKKKLAILIQFTFKKKKKNSKKIPISVSKNVNILLGKNIGTNVATASPRAS